MQERNETQQESNRRSREQAPKSLEESLNAYRNKQQKSNKDAIHFERDRIVPVNGEKTPFLDSDELENNEDAQTIIEVNTSAASISDNQV